MRTARDGASRAAILDEAAIFVPALEGLSRVSLEAAAAGAAIASPPGVEEQPELAAAALARLAENEPLRERLSQEARRSVEGKSFADVAGELEELYADLAGRRRGTLQHGVTKSDEPLADRDWILADLHLHTSWSHDCTVEVDDLLDNAEAQGLGAIAVTDHNVFGGALEAVELARDRDLIVIPGEEVKTDGQGEVIGLFLSEEIPRGHVVRRHRRRDQGPGRPRLPPAPLRPPALRSPTRRPCAATWPTSTSSRSTTRGSCSRATTTKRSGSRASTT